MAIRRVFIFWTHPLFHEAVRLLLNHPKIEWVGASSSYATDWQHALSASPDTILVEEVDGLIPIEIMRIFETSQEGLRIVGLNLHDNQMHTYHRIEQTVGKAEDLLNWIIDNTA